MGFTKFATFEDAKVLDVKGSSTREVVASLDRISDFHDYRTDDGYMYVRLRAISSRVNKNNDGWPSIELAGGPDIFERHAKHSSTGFTVEAAEGNPEFGFRTFLGKPNFIDHNNSDPKRARGVVVDAKLKVLPLEKVAAAGDSYWGSASMDPEHAPPTEIELLIEIDAKKFPKYAKLVRNGEIDGFSMGCDVESSKCSHCGHIATNPDEYCSHIVMKGAHHDYKTADGSRISRKSYENCYGIHFFEISAVFDPADETALAREVRAGVEKTSENPLPQSFELSAPEPVDTTRDEQTCPECGAEMEGETCDKCGYTKPPEGYGNPDLARAQELQQAMEQGAQGQVDQDLAESQGQQPAPAPGGPAPTQRQPGSFLQTRNRGASASVMGDMRWQPKLNPKLAARIKQFEKPLLPGSPPASNDPATTQIVKSPQKPVTAAMQTAQDLIEATNQGDTMSRVHTADGPTGPEASPDARVDVTGVGGVIEPSNEAASKADAQVDVTGTGSTGVTDVESDKTESLPTASESSDDSGFDATKTTEDSGPTSTFGDSDGSHKGVSDPVTGESLEEAKWGGGVTGARVAYDSEPFYDQPGLSGGSANKGVEPVDPVGKAQERVNVLEPTATPENNSGPTSQWTGTDGNGVLRQQDPVTSDSMALGGGGVGTDSPNWTSHITAALKLADEEERLGLISGEDKYNRFQQLIGSDDEQIKAEAGMLSRVKEAGTRKLAQQRQSGVTRLPGSFGRTTASSKIIAGDAPEPETVAEDVGDSALFSK